MSAAGGASRRPEVKGKIHAWVGIIVGGFFGLGYLALAVLFVVGAIIARSGAY